MNQNKHKLIPKISLWYFVSIFAVFSVPLLAKASVLYLLPPSQTIYQEDSFIVTAMIDTEGEGINTVEGYLGFPPDKLEVTDITRGGSILSLWVKEPSFSNQTGEINFIGGIPKGFYGQGQLISVIFRVLPRIDPRLSASINFKENSRVLLNDGKGTEARLNFSEGNYEVIERPEGLPVISSQTHPDQNKWYQGTTLSLYWDLVEGAEYSWILSRDPLTGPDEIPDEPLPKEGVAFWMGAMEYDLKEEGDGIYYFHLREKRGIDAEQDAELRGRWGPKITFRAMIDATPPEEFELQITEIEGKKYLVFLTKDETSGVEYYEVAEVRPIAKLREILSRETTLKWKRGKSPYLLEDQSLRSKILVKAIDKTGNERIAEYLPAKKPFPYWIIISILVGIGIVIWLIAKLRQTVRKTTRKYE